MSVVFLLLLFSQLTDQLSKCQKIVKNALHLYVPLDKTCIVPPTEQKPKDIHVTMKQK